MRSARKIGLSPDAATVMATKLGASAAELLFNVGLIQPLGAGQ